MSLLVAKQSEPESFALGGTFKVAALKYVTKVYTGNSQAHLLSCVSHADLLYSSRSTLPFNTSIHVSHCVFVSCALYILLL